MRHPQYGAYFSKKTAKKYIPSLSRICEVHFPKSELTDRTFGIIDPEIHSDIAWKIANDWDALLDVIFNCPLPEFRPH
jgi:hypothetical protein